MNLKAFKKLQTYTNIALIFVFMKLSNILPENNTLDLIFQIVLLSGVITTLVWLFLQFSNKTKY